MPTCASSTPHLSAVGHGAARLRVVIADDHPFYRSGLARQLRDSGISVVAEVSNGESAIREVDQRAPDVVVMDLRMPRVSGLEATRRLADRGHGPAVLVLTVSADEADITAAMLAGACGYVLKDEPLEEILAAIRAAAVGRPRISPRIATALLRHIRDLATDAERLAGVHLSQRELEVLDLLAEGKGLREIAETLTLSTRTVEKDMSTTLMKLQIESRVQTALHDDVSGRHGDG